MNSNTPKFDGGSQSAVKTTRRRFLQKTALAASALTVVPRHVLGGTAQAAAVSHVAPPAGLAAEICETSAVRVFTVNEAILDKDGQDLALSVPSQMILRGWFRWHNARDYAEDAWVIQPFHERGISFGGGTTLSALFRGENGLTEGTFLDYATRDPWNNLYRRVNGAIANKKFLDYALSWAKKQIDAGVDNIFIDEADGAYTIHEGFDDYGLAGFCDWLTRRYCDGRNWSATDARWTDFFKIDFHDAAICQDGTISSFNYRNYLQARGWADQPDHPDNPLREEWGWPTVVARGANESHDNSLSGEEWGWPTELGVGTSYCAERREQAWLYQCNSLRQYAQSIGRKVQITDNGLNRHVDFQIHGVSQASLAKKDGRLDISKSYVGMWRGAMDWSRQLLGRDVPVVFFHDWGGPLSYYRRSLTGDDHKMWLTVYAPEIYAAGGFFAFPVHGPASYDARTDGSLALIKKLAEFFNEHAALYRNTKWLSERLVATDPPRPLVRGQVPAGRPAPAPAPYQPHLCQGLRGAGPLQGREAFVPRAGRGHPGHHPLSRHGRSAGGHPG